ncbi:MAG TPA: acetyl-CoA acetyltransferase, partial [Mycobacterium sp.]|nr:acetyl-CoA acetyltransferase [Mycobacterium sp.]
ELQAQIGGRPAQAVTETADGAATIETYTVRRDSGRLTGIIIGRLDADGTRFLSTTEDDDLITLLIDGDPLGSAVRVRSFEYGNRCTLG